MNEYVTIEEIEPGKEYLVEVVGSYGDRPQLAVTEIIHCADCYHWMNGCVVSEWCPVNNVRSRPSDWCFRAEPREADHG